MTRAPHITGYTILTCEDPHVLATQVESAIHDGWQPHGSLSISPRGDGYAAVFAQAMVRYSEWGV